MRKKNILITNVDNKISHDLVHFLHNKYRLFLMSSQKEKLTFFLKSNHYNLSNIHWVDFNYNAIDFIETFFKNIDYLDFIIYFSKSSLNEQFLTKSMSEMTKDKNMMLNEQFFIQSALQKMINNRSGVLIFALTNLEFSNFSTQNLNGLTQSQQEYFLDLCRHEVQKKSIDCIQLKSITIGKADSTIDYRRVNHLIFKIMNEPHKFPDSISYMSKEEEAKSGKKTIRLIKEMSPSFFVNFPKINIK